MRKTGRKTFMALILALFVLQMPAFGTDSEETTDGDSAITAEVSASDFTQTGDCIEVEGTLWYKVPELIAGQDHLILMDNGENAALLSVTAGEESSAVWSCSVDAMGGSSSSLVCLGYSVGCGESGLTLSAVSQDTGGPSGGRPPDGERPDGGHPPMQRRSAWTCSQGRLTFTSGETDYWLCCPGEEEAVPGCTTEETEAAAVTIYTSGPLFGSCILSQPEAADYVTAGSGYSAPVFSVQTAEALTEPLVEWYVDDESAGTGKTFTAEVLEDRQAGRYSVSCIVSGQDSEGYYYRERSCAVNFFVCTGVIEDSFLIFSDVHEEYEKIGAAIEEVMAANDGKIPSLVVCTGDWVNGFNVGVDKLRSIYLPQIDAQLGGLDTVYVAGNHEAAAGAVEENLKAGLGATESGLAGGAGIIFDSAVSAQAGKNSRLTSGLVVYAVNYACVEQSGSSYAYSSVLPELEAFLRQRAEDYRGELIVIAAHAGLHTLGIQPESRGDGEEAEISEWSGGSSYNVDGSDQIAALLNEYAQANDMDILFLFGHDHSKGEVEFFLSRGDELISTVSYDEKTTASGILGFLYGHSGYLSDMIGSANEHYSLFRWNQEEILRDYGELGQTREQRTFPRLAAKQIRFEANDGQGEMAAQTALRGTETALTPNIFTRPGWRFINWNTAADGSGTPYSDGQTVVMTGDLTLYAQWKEHSSGGGSSGGGAASAANPVTVPSAAAHGKVSSGAANAKAGDKVTLTVTPDRGYEVEDVVVKDAKGNIVPVMKNADGAYSFIMPATAVSVEPVFAEAAAPAPSFVDVPADAWYADAVAWAVEQGITDGADATHFSPNVPCTRAQTVTFLWRAAGEPEPVGAATQFQDITAGSYYEKAVAWAVEIGITNGVSDTAFAPNDTVTRGQVVTFLWRYEGEPEAAAAAAFTDVPSDAWYADAVRWAAGKGITTGVDDTRFAPNDDCVRAQIVTFLYRDMAG